MTLQARPIAVQGLGAGILALALHGLVPVVQAPAPPLQAAYAGGGGPGAQIGRREFLRRLAPVERDERRRREEEELLVLAALDDEDYG